MKYTITFKDNENKEISINAKSYIDDGSGFIVFSNSDGNIVLSVAANSIMFIKTEK